MGAVLSVRYADDWVALQRERVESELAAAVQLADEQTLDTLWSEAWTHTAAYVLRPGKRVRPLLVLAAHAIATGDLDVSDGLMSFAVANELLHTFMLIHDDVADRAAIRRGGPALQHLLGGGALGDQCAVVAGDHLFALAVERAFLTGLPRAQQALSVLLRSCRHTAAGQYLDLRLANAPLSQVSLFQTLKVAQLKTARFGFVAPLVAGAILAGASTEMVEKLERAGKAIGIAYQLSDDLIGLFGNDAISGKPGASDFYEAKPTFPVVAAYCRAEAEGRIALEELWSASVKTPEMLREAQTRVLKEGGVAATRRAIDRSIRSALRALESLPNPGGVRDVIASLAHHCRERKS